MKISGNHNIEKKLLSQLAQGDRKAYRQLYTSHLDSVYRFVLPFVNHEKYEAERIVQDVFVSIWERRKKIGQYPVLRKLYIPHGQKSVVRSSKTATGQANYES